MNHRPLAFALTLAIGATATFASPRPALAGDARAAAPSADVAERAARLKKQGDEAILNIKFADAIRFYDESLRLVPNPALHYNRGRAFEALERTVEAIAAYETFLLEAPADLRAKTQGLAAHVEELRKKTTKLTIDADVVGARVRLRQVVIGKTPITPLVVNSGPVTVDVEADGYVPYRSDVELPGGGELTVRVHLVPKPQSAAAVTEPTPAPASAEESPNLLKRWWFWTGVGVVVAGGATVLVVALSSKSEPAAREGTLGTVSAPLLRF